VNLRFRESGDTTRRSGDLLGAESDMTSRWRPEFNPDHLYFITTVANGHQPIFHRLVFRRLLVDALDCIRLRYGVKLFAFVIMPNHIHLLMRFYAKRPLKDFMRDYKKGTADRILRQLKLEDKQLALERLRTKEGYSVWEKGYNAKAVFSVDFLLQKLEYIHNNPCQEHWQLAESPEAYLWSSAVFYHTDKPCLIPVDDVRKLLDD